MDITAQELHENDIIVRKTIDQLQKLDFSLADIGMFFGYMDKHYARDLPPIMDQVAAEGKVPGDDVIKVMVVVFMTYAIDLRHKGII